MGGVLKQRSGGGASGIEFLKDDDGNIQRSSSKIRSMLFDHFSEMYCHGAEGYDIMMEGEFQHITAQEVVAATTRTSIHKAHPAGDVFPAMFRRWVKEKGAVLLAGIYSKMVQEDTWPEEWELTRAVLLHKGGERTKKRYRIVVVDWYCRKLIEKILCMRIEPIIEKKYIKYQFGFRRDLTCGHMIHILRLVAEKSLEWGRDLYVMKHDILGAFDYVSHKYLHKALLRAGVDNITAALVMKLAAKVRLLISSSTFELEVIICNRGVKQGGLMSPILFNLVIATALEGLEEWAQRGSMGIDMTSMGALLPCCIFADDFIILARTLLMMMKICEYIMSCLIDGGTGLDFNWEKSELITNVECEGEVHIEIRGRDVKVKEGHVVKILGSTFHVKGGSMEDWAGKLGTAGRVTRQLRSLCTAAGSVPYRDRMRLLQVTTLQSVLWNIESLGMTTDQCRVLFHLLTVSSRYLLRVRALEGETPAQYIHRTADIVKQLATEHNHKNWHEQYLRRLHEWPMRILGTLTMDVLKWRDAKWSYDEQLKGKSAIRRPSRKRFKRWEDVFVKSFGLDWKVRALNPEEWGASLPQFLASRRCR